ncbi:hypothetical protein RJ640_014611 [Escallonia rubra]|uniref:Pectinesterase inhibitor domain-containing protein n=1 Tax=Escallonia rubra TaxID=112253 RepID=A0AA88QXD8_9ASTE|nr:hypothetical protein RJ640_014611 [Escallonia rubra]
MTDHINLGKLWFGTHLKIESKLLLHNGFKTQFQHLTVAIASVKSSSQLISEVCSKVPNSALCLEALKSDPRSANADLASREIRFCSECYGRAVNDLDDSEKSLSFGKYLELNNFVAVALGEKYLCEDNFASGSPLLSLLHENGPPVAAEDLMKIGLANYFLHRDEPPPPLPAYLTLSTLSPEERRLHSSIVTERKKTLDFVSELNGDGRSVCYRSFLRVCIAKETPSPAPSLFSPTLNSVQI